MLLAKLAGAMKASMAGAAATFAALPVQMARLLAALEAKRTAEAPAEAAAPADSCCSCGPRLLLPPRTRHRPTLWPTPRRRRPIRPPIRPARRRKTDRPHWLANPDDIQCGGGTGRSDPRT